MRSFRKWRFWQWLYACTHSYFWLPCPICGKNFGGHEWQESLYDSWSSGRGVCPSCSEEAKRRNREFFASHPHPIVIVTVTKLTTSYEQNFQTREL